MAFRFSFALALLVLSLNISTVFNIEKANPIEKSFVLLSAIILVARGSIDKTRLGFACFILLGTFLAAALTDYAYFEWGYYFRAMVTLVAVLLFLVTVPREEDAESFLKLLAFVPLLQVGLGVSYNAVGIWKVFQADSFGVVRLAGSTIPAFLGGVSAAATVAAMAYASERDMRYIILVGLNTIILLLSGARMATAAAAIGCMGILFFGFSRNRPAKYLIMVGGALAALVAVPILGQALLERAGSGSLQGRELLWGFLAGFVRDYPWFGVGLGAQYTLVPPRIVALTATVAAHNEYLRLTVEIGYVGGIMFLIGLLGIFFSTANSRYCVNRGGYFLVVLAFMIFSATDNTLTRFEVAALLIVAAYGTMPSLKARNLHPRMPTPTPPPATLGGYIEGRGNRG